MGNIAQKRLRGDDRFQPREAFRPLPEVFERGPARRIFEACELAPLQRMAAGIEAGLLGLAQGSRHPRIERLMDLGTHMTHDAVKRLKRRELKALLNGAQSRH